MGFWKDVLYDVQNGISKERAIELNAKIRYGSEEERQKAEAMAEAEIKLNTIE